MSDTITVSDFINTKYREFWEYSNKNGKNAIDAREQIPEVVRKIIYSSYRIGIKEYDEHKTTELAGETGKIHAHGGDSIESSIKGLATAYKSQPSARVLEGIGNFGYAPGDDGAAARYTSVSGTPLLTAIYRDIPYVPFNTEDTGLEQPEYISVPLPLALICGASQIGTGKSCYVAERNAKDVINWIDKLRKADWKLGKIKKPDATSVTGCKTYFNNENGYVYYDAIVHYKVNVDDLNKKGVYDIITALPPKSTADNTIYKLINKLPTKASKRIIDGSGRGRNVYIIVPTGYLDESEFTKYGMRTARKEQVYIWDFDENTMKLSDIDEVAHGWFEDRCEVVTRRIADQIHNLEKINHKIDLIKEFADNKMITWKSEDVLSHFVKLDAETGEDDTNIVLSSPARAFLPENIGKNQILREKNDANIKTYQNQIDNIGDTIISEAYEVIKKQEAFFKES